MKKIFQMILGLALPWCGYSQNVDSTRCYYSEFKLAPRIGVSYQRSLFVDLGLSFNEYSVGYRRNAKYSNFGMAFWGAFLSSEVLVRTDKTIIGPKIGFEFSSAGATGAAALGIELTYFSDFDRNALAITPKVGLPLGGFEFFYAYSFFSNKDLKSDIGNHRFGLSMNINRLYWRKQTEAMDKYQVDMKSPR